MGKRILVHLGVIAKFCTTVLAEVEFSPGNDSSSAESGRDAIFGGKGVDPKNVK